MDHVTIRSLLGHEEGVDVGFSKEGWDVRNARRNVKVLCLSDLALVTCPNIPAHVLVEVRPPEPDQYVARGRVNSFVSKSVVSVGDNDGTSRNVGYELWSSVWILSEEYVPDQIIVHSVANEQTILIVG